MKTVSFFRVAGAFCLALSSFSLVATATKGSEPNSSCPSTDTHVRALAEVKSIHVTNEDTYSATLSMHLVVSIVNISTENVIILGEEPLTGGVALSWTKDDAESCRYMNDRSYWPSRDTSPRWRKLRNALDKNSPPDGITRIIAPGSSWQFEEDVRYFIEKTKVDQTGDQPLSEIRKRAQVWFNISLMMWPNNIEENMLNPKFGYRLRKKWKGRGYLILDSYLDSEPVPITLPEK